MISSEKKIRGGIIIFICIFTLFQCKRNSINDLIYLNCKNAGFDQYSIPAYAPFVCGTGQENDHYKLAFPEGLQKWSMLASDFLGNQSIEWNAKWGRQRMYVDLILNLDMNEAENNRREDPAWLGLRDNPAWAAVNMHPIYNGTEINSTIVVFEGNGLTISNIILTGMQMNRLGLFSHLSSRSSVSNLNVLNVNINNTVALVGVGGLIGEINEGTIRNVHVDNLTMNSISNRVGGVVGFANNTRIDDSSFSGSISSNAGTSIGGLVGSVVANSEINNARASGTISGNGNGIGGLVGNMETNSRINNSRASNSILSDVGDFLGGLVGFMNTSVIEGSSTSGSVSGNGESLGGLVGSMIANSQINNSSSSSSISSDTGNFVGGLVGLMNTSTIEGSSTSGSVSGNGNALGGLVGSMVANSEISNSSSSCVISGNGETIGGLVGSMFTNSRINNSSSSCSISGNAQYLGGAVGSISQSNLFSVYATGDVSGLSRVGGLVGFIFAGATTTIDRVYSTGTVSASGTGVGIGSGVAGGLIAQNAMAVGDGTIRNAYTRSNVNSPIITDGGGVLGFTDGPGCLFLGPLYTNVRWDSTRIARVVGTCPVNHANFTSNTSTCITNIINTSVDICS